MTAGVRTVAEGRVGMVLRRRWRLERVIGVGGTAAVYAATHRNGSRVAVKILHPSLHADPTTLHRFLQEGYLANKVGVAEVVKILDDDVEGDIAYLVMELLEGASLETLRQRAGGRLPAADVLDIALRLLRVLEAAHARGIVHRDIKPENLFRTVDPLAFKVLDFGIAHAGTQELGLGQTTAEPRGCAGTPVFMAPEQARGERERLDARTDLWAVGATMFTLLTGAFVHAGHTASEVLEAACEGTAPALSHALPDVPEGLAAVVDRALSFHPRARYQSATEMKVACHDALLALSARGQRSTLFTSCSWPPQSPNRSTLATIESRAPSMSGAFAPQPAVERTAARASTSELQAGHWMGRVGRLWWFYFTGPCGDDTWWQYLAMLQLMVDSKADVTLACFAYRAGAPSALQRKQMAELIETNRVGLARLDRCALVIDSVTQRGAITAIGWLVRKPFEERVFHSPVSAIKWLVENQPDVDPETVRSSIVAQVPSRSLWRVLESDAAETRTQWALA